jgi:small subunit ribosomal protein S1
VTEPTEDFAAMFEASVQPKRVEKGHIIEGTIVAIGPEVAFVDVGGKGEATIDIDELKDAEGDLEVAVGDRVQAMVMSTA